MNKISGWALSLAFILAGLACESEKRFPPKGFLPVSSQATENLEASYFWIPQDKPNSPYWKDAPYLEVSLSDLTTGDLYDDGYLNATGTYDGTRDFNKGREPSLRVKAGYDEEYIYILLEWKDTTSNPAFFSWLFNGPSDPLKTDSAGGWTSQQNPDNFMLLFDLPGEEVKDVWKWSLATTAPFDQASNLSSDANGNLSGDDIELVRNGSAENSRSGPDFEWNGQPQDITLPDGTRKLLDPAYFLLDDFKTAYTGDAGKGQIYFNEVANCSYCHGENGNGDPEDPDNAAKALNKVFTNRKSRTALNEFIGSSGHTGGGSQYFGRIEGDPEKVNDLLAFLRGIAGVPGHSLIVPDELSEIKSLVNIGTGNIDAKNSTYQVLLKRKLVNDNPLDVQFNPDQTYHFSIRIADNDLLNYVGADALELIFKSNEL